MTDKKIINEPKTEIKFLTQLKPVSSRNLCLALRNALNSIWTELTDEEKEKLISSEIPLSEDRKFSFDKYFNGLTTSEIFLLFKLYKENEQDIYSPKSSESKPETGAIDKTGDEN